MFRITDVVKHLLIINIIVFVASELIGIDKLALYPFGTENFQPYQLVTHFFMHANFSHLFFNMFALWMFGSPLEASWGPKRFLFFYFFAAFGAALIHMGVQSYDFHQIQNTIDAFIQNPDATNYWAFFNDVPLDRLNSEYVDAVNQIGSALENGKTVLANDASQAMEMYLQSKMNVPTVGASGAIYGLLLAFGMLFPNTKLMLIFFPVPIKAKYFIPIMMVGELFFGINQFSWDNIAHFAHLGGALFGFLLILYWRKFGSSL